MTSFKPYLSEIEAPNRSDVQARQGLSLLEFGTEWCGHCRAAQPLIARALAEQPRWQPVSYTHLTLPTNREV